MNSCFFTKKFYSSVKYFFLIVLVFFFIFGFPVKYFPVNSSKLALTFLFFWYFIYTLFTFKFFYCKINVHFIIFVISLLFLAIISLLFVFLHATNDFSIPYAYFIFLFEATLGSYILYVLFLKKYSFEELLNILIVLCFLQALIIIFMFLFEHFRDFIFYISNSNESITQRYGGFRGLGLAASTTYDLSVFLSIGLMFISYLALKQKKNRLFYVVSWLAVFFAVLMTGRTGWVGIFFSIAILFLNILNFNILKLLFKIIVAGILASYIAFSALYYFYPKTYHVLTSSVIPYSFEIFINLHDKGSLSTVSTDKLKKMYFGVGEKTFWIGDGYWKNPSGFGYYMSTDAGYMRHILFYGIFPSIFLYFFYMYGFFQMTYSLGKSFNNTMLVLMLCGYFFLAHYKGDFLMGSPINIKLFCILFVYLVLSRSKVNNENNPLHRQHAQTLRPHQPALQPDQISGPQPI